MKATKFCAAGVLCKASEAGAIMFSIGVTVWQPRICSVCLCV